MIAPASEDGRIGRFEKRDICLCELNAEISVTNGNKADQGMLEGGHHVARGGKGLD